MNRVNVLSKTSVLLLLLLSSSAAQAACNLELFRFGYSPQYVAKELGLIPKGQRMFPPGEEAPAQFDISFPGNELCPHEKALKSTLIEFVFLYGKLAKIKTKLLSPSPTVVFWAESVYGEKKDKPMSFYALHPSAQWVWATEKSTIAYSVIPAGDEVFESLIIESNTMQTEFNKFSQAHEKSLLKRAP